MVRCCRVLTVLAMLATVASTLSVYPHQLAYFNELAGGRLHGDEHLLGSNVDWGQDLLYVKQWRSKHRPTGRFYLAYHGGFDPRSIGIQFQALPFGPKWGAMTAFALNEGCCAISINCIRGDDSQMRHREAYVALVQQARVERVGASFVVFDIDSRSAEQINRMLNESESEAPR
jgi:hypothetical protein